MPLPEHRWRHNGVLLSKRQQVHIVGDQVVCLGRPQSPEHLLICWIAQIHILCGIRLDDRLVVTGL